MRRCLHSTLVSCLAKVAILVSAVSMAHAQNPPLPTDDQAAIRKLLDQYRAAWLSGDAAGVRSVFTEDAVLMPHHGVTPVVGMAAIKEFWWPAGGARTTITQFVQTLDEIGGNESLAYVRGRSQVSWKIEDQKSTEMWRNAGNFMALFRKQDAKWRIARLIWDDPPNERVK